MLQKPRCGTIFRLTRSAIGIGGKGYDLPAAGGLGKNGFSCTWLRYSAGRLSSDGTPVFGDSFSATVSNGDNSKEPTRLATAALVLTNFLRFIFYFLIFAC
jgi:hypothetical protein